MELIHPASAAEVVDAVRRADEDGRRLLVVAGRRHLDRGNPTEVDAELWTTQLDAVVAYEPAEMVAVVEAGVRVGDLQRRLAGSAQEWPVDAPDDATVGGVIASGASSARRLKVGAVRDTVLEAEIVTGDGRKIRSGARTVKNVTGYDLHKVVAGSLGTLGVIVQVAVKLRPLARVARSYRLDGGFEVATAALEAVPTAAGVLVTPAGVEVRLEGWPAEVEDQSTALAGVAAPREVDAATFPSSTPWADEPIVAEVAVAPSRLPTVLDGARSFGAVVGLGLAWVGLRDADELADLRGRVARVGGIAPVVRGPGGLGDASVPALEVQRRLKDALDPNGVLAPGRGWGGI